MVDTVEPFSRKVNLNSASAARIYDAFLGGSHNLGIEQRFVRDALDVLPNLAESYRENRGFLRRAVEHLRANGVDQFLDLGSGIPTIGPVHEIARRQEGDFRVVYVDNEPLTVAHSAPLLVDEPRAEIIEADCRDPESVLDSPTTRRLIDLDRPVGLIMSSVLHHLSDADAPDELVGRYCRALVPGSYLCLTHFTDSFAPRAAAVLRDLYARSSDPVHPRPIRVVDGFFGDLALVPPGRALLQHWHPDAGERPRTAYPLLYGGLARITTNV